MTERMEKRKKKFTQHNNVKTIIYTIVITHVYIRARVIYYIAYILLYTSRASRVVHVGGGRKF